MCCSMRATVFFLASYHIWFALTQVVIMVPKLISSISENIAACLLAVIYSTIYTIAGMLIFRGADKESTWGVGWGAVTLLLVLAKRYVVMYYGLLLVPTLPEGDFLNPYGHVVPVVFTVILYLFYTSILFCYWNELKYAPTPSCLTPLACRKQFPQSSNSLALSVK